MKNKKINLNKIPTYTHGRKDDIKKSKSNKEKQEYDNLIKDLLSVSSKYPLFNISFTIQKADEFNFEGILSKEITDRL